MLLSFRLANALSIRDEQQLSLVATELNDGSAWTTGMRDEGKPVSLVPLAVVYGANASGKSNVLAALRMMRTAVLNSVEWVTEQEPLRRIPFLLDPEYAKEPSFFEIDLELNDVRHTYGFEIDDRLVRAEWLHAYPKGRRQVWFDRDGDDIRFPGDGLRGDKLDLARKTRPDALFLTVAAGWNHEQLLPVFSWFRDNLQLISPEHRRNLWHAYTRDRVLRDELFRDQVIRLLTVADLGITGFDADALSAGELRLLHCAGDHTASLDFAFESMGTRSWFAMLGVLLQAFEQGTTVLVDELDASLHPAIAAEVIRLFKDENANPHRAQLICTTHDALLMQNPPLGADRVLDRDQIWLTEKDASGATQIYPLTGFQPPPRKGDNLLRKYLLGRWGGTPRLSPGEFAREVEESHR